jgi:DNA-directed RNA polymerase specialized sigma24 family protein
MLGSRSGAEDVVQEAFCGLCRHWGHLPDGEKALRYVQSSVMHAALARRIVIKAGRPAANSVTALPTGSMLWRIGSQRQPASRRDVSDT